MSIKNNTTILQNLLEQVNNLPEGNGIDTSDATATAADIVQGETAYVDGIRITGTNPYELTSTNQTVEDQSALIDSIADALSGKVVGGGDTCVVQFFDIPCSFVCYTGSSGSIYETVINDSITVLKNSIIVFEPSTTLLLEIVGDAESLHGGSGCYVIAIHGDTILVNND